MSAWNLIRLSADVVTASEVSRRISAARPDAVYEEYVWLTGACSRISQEMSIPHVLEVNDLARLTGENLSPSLQKRAYRMEDEVPARTHRVS